MYNISMNKDFCVQCGECCKNIPVDFDTGQMYFDGIQPLTAEFKKMLVPVNKTKNITFCSCKYLVENLCTNPNKPEECVEYPSSPFAFLPLGCGYYGEIFIKSEKIKQKIRKLKEEIIHYELMSSKDKNIQKIINHHQTMIEKYKTYGSDNW